MLAEAEAKASQSQARNEETIKAVTRDQMKSVIDGINRGRDGGVLKMTVPILKSLIEDDAFMTEVVPFLFAHILSSLPDNCFGLVILIEGCSYCKYMERDGD